MSRSENAVIVRADLRGLEREQLEDVMVPVLTSARHLVNTHSEFLASVRNGDYGAVLLKLDQLGLLE